MGRSGPRVIEQSRAKMTLAIAGSLAFVAVGVLLMDQPGGRYGPGSARAISLLCIAVFGVFALMGVGQLLRPARLVLDAAGLTYEGLWWQRSWAWRDVGEFVVERGARQKALRFSVDPSVASGSVWTGGGPRPMIGGGWRVGLDEVCKELNAARERWR